MMRGSWIETELGRLYLAANERGLCRVELHEAGIASLTEVPVELAEAARQLQEYARVDRRGSEFELRVWNALRAIPWGQTRTYGEIARAIGDPGAARAVGRANGCNPLPILVPCHRVVSSTGLGGFSAGLEWKQRLLALERVQLFA
jgi:O-6-methylguanine DNA methyltransferase